MGPPSSGAVLEDAVPAPAPIVDPSVRKPSATATYPVVATDAAPVPERAEQPVVPPVQEAQQENALLTLCAWRLSELRAGTDARPTQSFKLRGEYATLCFSPDGDQLAVGNSHGEIRIFGFTKDGLSGSGGTLGSGAKRGEKQQGCVRLRFSPSGHRLAVGRYPQAAGDKPRSGRVPEVGESAEHHDALSIEGLLGAMFRNIRTDEQMRRHLQRTHHWGSALEVWQLDERRKRVLAGADSLVHHFEFAPDQERLITGCGDGTYRIFDCEDAASEPLLVDSRNLGDRFWAFSRNAPSILDEAKAFALLTVGDRRMGSLFGPKTILWTISANRVQREVEVAVPELERPHFLQQDGFSLVRAGAILQFLEFSKAASELIDVDHRTRSVRNASAVELQGHESEVRWSSYSPSREQLVSVSVDGEVRRWELPNGTPKSARFDRVCDWDAFGFAESIAVSDPSGQIALCDSSGSLMLIDAQDRQTVLHRAAKSGPANPISRVGVEPVVVFSADKRALYLRQRDGGIDRFDLRKQPAERTAVVAGHTPIAHEVAVSSPPDWLVTVISEDPPEPMVPRDAQGDPSAGLVSEPTWWVKRRAPQLRLIAVNLRDGSQLAFPATLDARRNVQVACSKGMNTIAIGSDRELIISQRRASKRVSKRLLLKYPIVKLALSPPGDTLAIAVADSQTVGLMRGHEGAVHGVVYSINGGSIVACPDVWTHGLLCRHLRFNFRRRGVIWRSGRRFRADLGGTSSNGMQEFSCGHWRRRLQGGAPKEVPSSRFVRCCWIRQQA